MTFHEGEREMQRRADVVSSADRVGRSIRNRIDGNAAAFLEAQPFLFLGSRDEAGRVWASLRTGAPGFARVLDELRLDVASTPAPRGPVGLLAIDFARRMRLRLNGEAEPRAGGFVVHAKEVYGNCPKYIQRRVLEAELPAGGAEVASSPALSADQQDFVRRADTFFMASLHPEGNADVSHRGGRPGFVRAGPEVLEWDDYLGNNMFNTLGNLVADPRAGLLFLDFEGGRTLQLSGRASVRGERTRTLEFRVDQVVDDPAGNPYRWRFVDFSPFNPRS